MENPYLPLINPFNLLPSSIIRCFRDVARLSAALFVVMLMADQAQAQAITVSEELVLRNDYAYTILGKVGNDIMLFRDKGHQFFVQAFGEDLRMRWEREVYLGPKKIEIIGIESHEDRFHLIYGLRERNTYRLMHRSYSRDINLIDSVEIDLLQDVNITPRIGMKISEDKSKIILFHETNSILTLHCYDLNALTLVWSGTTRLSGSGYRRNFTSIAIGNNGEFFMTLETDRFMQKSNKLDVLFANSNGIILQESVSLRDVQLLDFRTTYDNVNGNFVIAGMYSERNTGRAQGFFFLRYHPGLPAEISTLPFDEALLAEVYGKDVALSRGLTDFRIRQIALRQDGGAVVIAEVNKEFSRRSGVPMRRENGLYVRGGWVDYYVEDLLLFAIHPDGTEHWKKVLRKRQYSQDDDAIYSSYFLFKTPNRLRFLFNDEIKQENTVGGYEVSGTGQVERKTVFNTDYQRLKLRFRDGVQIAHNECIIPSERSNRLNLVRIRY